MLDNGRRQRHAHRIGHMDNSGVDVQVLSLLISTLDDLDVPTRQSKKIAMAAVTSASESN
jgi:hypothetical protein